MVAAPSAAALLATIYTLVVIAAAVIGARIYVRLKLQKKKLLLSDIFIIAAWCSALTSASFGIVLNSSGALRPNISYTLRSFQADKETFEYVLRMLWASVIPLFTTFYLCKASLLAVYLQLFPNPFFFFNQYNMLISTLWVVIGYCAIAYVVSIGLQLFLCFPIERNCSLCDEAVTATIFQVAWTLHFTGNLLLFGFPFLILYKLQLRCLRTRMKIGICSVFMLGLVDIAFSLTRFLSVQLPRDGDFRSITLIELWSALDAYVGLIIACLPSLRPLLRRNLKSSDEYSYDASGRPTRPVPPRRPGQSGFEEIDEMSYPGAPEASGPIGGTRHRPADPLDPGVDNGWISDKKSNRSDVELVNIDARPPP
ncbi:hypothetical protein IWW34DRAFT_638448 [Fusarium oxysporum f. sp. albedinis]|nr:hypothetical protein IWW34DRAFT_638448 [Fusarium oxysporum f. sp. albedinis]